ncbi:hypothetical protein N4T77_18925 [Clostridium sp. CX1]|uniref:hypothetical protein n=1 Tax=Clostridium sp. CX1 TaxID=2978346 RepID=UPI0021BE714E|nr:hypothetical protein [Clostridium sp. CX1]MCT8978667.1 hypothetical protein [Clostridium sp. CX1]
MNQVYQKKEYVIIKVGNDFIVINKNKEFKNGHTHVKRFDIATLLIHLAINKQLPIKSKFVDSLVRISVDKKYIKDLEEFQKDNEEIDIRGLMSAPVYKRHKGAIRQAR